MPDVLRTIFGGGPDLTSMPVILSALRTAGIAGIPAKRFDAGLLRGLVLGGQVSVADGVVRPTAEADLSGTAPPTSLFFSPTAVSFG